MVHSLSVVTYKILVYLLTFLSHEQRLILRVDSTRLIRVHTGLVSLHVSGCRNRVDGRGGDVVGQSGRTGGSDAGRDPFPFGRRSSSTGSLCLLLLPSHMALFTTRDLRVLLVIVGPFSPSGPIRDVRDGTTNVFVRR